MIGPKAKVKYYPKYRMDLVITPVNSGGHNYEWQDGSGKIWCGGWSAGTYREAVCEAKAHLERKG